MGTFHVNGDISTNGNIKINALNKVTTASKLAAFIENDSQKGFGYVNLSDITVGAASKLATARTISLTGDVAGSASFDGSGNISIASTISVIENGLQVNNGFRVGNWYYRKSIGVLNRGTSYSSLDSQYKDGSYHRMWRLQFPTGSSLNGKLKVIVQGGYSGFNASGFMSKTLNICFDTTTLRINSGGYDTLSGYVEKDFRISELLYNSTAQCYEICVWQKNLSGNNNANVYIEFWGSSAGIDAINNIVITPVELTQDLTYTTPGGTTVSWETTPVFQNPFGSDVLTVVNYNNYALPLAGGTMTGSITLSKGTAIKDYNNMPMLEFRGSDSDGSGIRVGDYTARMVLLTQNDDVYHYRKGITADSIMLDSYNFNTYTVKKDGTGATGTWGISISGTATKATQDASGNVITSTYATKTELNNKVPTSRTINSKALSANITLTAADVGADASGSANTALTNAKSYTDTKVAAIVDSAPETLNTLNELAAALGDNPNFATSIATQLGNKANASDLTNHINNKSNPHAVTAAQTGALATSGGTLTGALMLTSGVHYGSTFPSGAQTGQIFFKKV